MQLRDVMKARVKENSRDLDVLFWLSRAALEIIAQAGLGRSMDPLTDDAANEFADAMRSFQFVVPLLLVEQIAN